MNHIASFNPQVELIEESSIRDMTRVALESGAANLAQGFPEVALDPRLEAAAIEAIKSGARRYTATWGRETLRRALAAWLFDRFALKACPENEIVITCGASEAIVATLMSLVGPGDGVVLFEPIYENYLPAIRLACGRAHVVPLDPFDGSWDPEALATAASKAKVLVLNTPANPSGKVFSRKELESIAEIAQSHDLTVVTDETYGIIVRDGVEHIAPATVDGLAGRCVSIASFSKTWAVTGWRVGWAIAPEPIMQRIKRVHDYLTICAPAPMQAALEVALGFDKSFDRSIVETYDRRQQILRDGLRSAGWRTNQPDGGYFLLLDIADLGIDDDREWAFWLAREHRVATVPGSAFLEAGMAHDDGRPIDRKGRFVRLSFAKSEAVLHEGIRRLKAGPGAFRRP